jgi:hypothetical protein
MTDATPTLRDDVLQVLAGAEQPIGLGAIVSALDLQTPSKEDRLELAKVLHKLKAEGAIVGTPDPENAHRLRYRVAENPPEVVKRRPQVRHAAKTAAAPRTSMSTEPLQEACSELEHAIAALVKDPSILAAVLAYGALREAVARRT